VSGFAVVCGGSVPDAEAGEREAGGGGGAAEEAHTVAEDCGGWARIDCDEVVRRAQ
jgi:hypothetical protein